MKKIAALLMAALCVAYVSALDVDRKEIDTGADGSAIEFINYTGPHSVIDSVEAIEGIGKDLGAGILSNGMAGERARYYVIHAVDAKVTTGLDADILILGEGAGVDHVDNLRRILSAYLSSAYGYSKKDSSTLATFITVYNAVYRGKIDTFKTRYKPVVTGYLTADKVGLSVLYSDWPGKTQIVIPLSDARLSGTLSAIDTGAVSGKDVVNKMREDKGAGVDTRKDMVDLKERESDQAQKRADTAQQQAAQAKADQTAKKQELTQAQKEAETAKKEAEAAKKEAAAKPDDKAAQEKAKAAQTTADEKSKTVAQKQDEVQKASDESAKKEEAAKVDQKLADTKQKEAQNDRKEIASDVQKQIEEERKDAQAGSDAALASALPGYMLKIVDEKTMLAELVVVDLNNGRELKKSGINSIRGRAMIDSDSGIVAIAGKKGGNAAIRMVTIDRDKLEITAQSADSIAEWSALVKNGNDFYAVIEEPGGSFVLGRFDAKMETKAKSTVTVMSVTPIVVTEKGLLVQDSSGKVLILRATDLTDQSK